ncbi:MAG: response regulator transcription factor [Verrucomicrobiae bacterium]|nr:response regulator transcription factor [Verrucomicrobiae bacterium]
MSRTTPVDIPAKQLLALHAAVDGNTLWKASRQLLNRCFSNHFIVAGFAFRGGEPMIIKRGKPAPPRDAEWWARNTAAHPMIHLMIEKPYRKIIRVTDFMTAEEIKALPYYSEFVAPEGWLYSVGLFIREGDELIGMLAVNRREDQGEFTKAEMDLFVRLYDHFETAFRRVALHQSTLGTTMTLAAMLSRLPLAVAVVSWRGEVSHINDPARQACLNWESTENDGHSNDMLSSAQLPEIIRTKCLEIASRITHSSRPNAGPPEVDILTLPHPKNNGQVAIIERILPRGEPLSPSAFLVRFELLQDPVATDTATLMSNYCSLTTAEKAVAQLLMDGKANSEIAEELGKSRGTVKKQTESIYRKLDIHDRRRLIAFRPFLEAARFLEENQGSEIGD